jgi:hypothetical protein
VLQVNAPLPNAMLWLPVVLLLPAQSPMAVLLLPPVVQVSEPNPTAMLFWPVVLHKPTPTPMAVLQPEVPFESGRIILPQILIDIFLLPVRQCFC